MTYKNPQRKELAGNSLARFIRGLTGYRSNHMQQSLARSIMNKDRLSFTFSVAALSISTFVWRDLFLFSKIFNAPAWAELLPDPMWAPCLISLLCLTPAALAPTCPRKAAVAILHAIAISPLPAIFAYFATSLHQDTFDLIRNVLFNYIWIAAAGYLTPAILLLSTKFIYTFLKNHIGAQRQQ